MTRPRQLSLPLTSGWGGRRRGAGRKRADASVRASTPHRSRGQHRSREPVHVTLRAIAGLPSLRAEPVFDVLTGAVRESERGDFRITHFSVQRDHIHLLVEASDEAALGNGMRSLTVRVARRMNAVLSRRGKVWGDRWHGHTLTTPGEVRRALAYVPLEWAQARRGPLRARPICIGGVVPRCVRRPGLPRWASAARGSARVAGCGAEDVAAQDGVEEARVASPGGCAAARPETLIGR